MINQKRPASAQSNASTEASVEITQPSEPMTIKIFGNEFSVPESMVGFYQRFWFWDSFKTYAEFLASFAFFMIAVTAILHSNVVFQHLIAFLSSSIEALLGIPQFLLNYRRQNTSGLA